MTESRIDDVAPILVPAPEVETPAPAVEVPEVPEKQITMSQSALDSLIKSRQSASLKKAAAAETELARVKAITVGSTESATEIEKLRAEISLKQQRASAAEARATEQEKAVLLTQLGTAIDAVSVSDVGKLIGDTIVQRDGKWTVVVNGVEQVNVDGTPVTPQQHYERWALDHAYAIRGRTLSGGGGTSSSGSSFRRPVDDKPLEFYFGPKSSAAAVNSLSINQPDVYRRKRAEAVRAGILVS
jgi:hypothetical protein